MADNIQPWPQQRQGFRPSPPGIQRAPFPGISQPGTSAAPGISSLTREERQEAKRIAEEANFSFDGYQVVRREFIFHRFDPAMTIRGNSITFNIDSVYDSRAMQPENARDKNVELKVDPDKFAMPEFKVLWKRISPKSVYVVDFDTDELVQKAISAINRNLHVSKIFFKVETGTMDEIKSKDVLLVVTPSERQSFPPMTAASVFM